MPAADFDGLKQIFAERGMDLIIVKYNNNSPAVPTFRPVMAGSVFVEFHQECEDKTVLTHSIDVRKITRVTDISGLKIHNLTSIWIGSDNARVTESYDEVMKAIHEVNSPPVLKYREGTARADWDALDPALAGGKIECNSGQ